MKNIFLLLCIFAHLFISTSSFAQFLGGNSDGFAMKAKCSSSLDGSKSTTLTVSNISGASQFCTTTNENYTVSVLTGYASSFLWSGPGNSMVINGQGSIAATLFYGDVSGVVKVDVSNSCETASKTLSVTAQICNTDMFKGGNNDGFAMKAKCSSSLDGSKSTALTISNITGATLFCKNTNENYTTSVLTGYATSFLWSGPNGAMVINGQGSTTSTLFYADVSGTVTVDANNGCGTVSKTLVVTAQICSTDMFKGGNNDGFAMKTKCSSSLDGSKTTTLTVSSISGASLFCKNTNENYSVSVLTGYASSYMWSVPKGSSIINGQGSTTGTVFYGDTSGIVKVDVSNACVIVSKTLAVTMQFCSTDMFKGGNNDGFAMRPLCSSKLNGSGVTSLVLASIVTPSMYSAGVCSLSNATYNASISQGYAEHFIWKGPTGSTILMGQGDNMAMVNFSAIGGYVKVTAYNSCQSISSSQVDSDSLNVSLITCNYFKGAYNDGFAMKPLCSSKLDGSGATSLVLASVTTPALYSAGVCSLSNATYNASMLQGYAEHFIWKGPTGSTILMGQGDSMAMVNFGATGGYVKVTTYNSCQSVSSQIDSDSLNVSLITCNYFKGDDNDGFAIKPLCSSKLNGSATVPVVINSIITPYSGGVCSQSNATYSISLAQGYPDHYYWTGPKGSTILAGQGDSMTLFNFGKTGGYVKVKAYNSCQTQSTQSDVDSLNVSLIACDYFKGGNNDGFAKKAICTTSLNGVTSVLKLGAITGPVFVSGGTGNYSVSLISGTATDYYWTVPTGSTISSGKNTNNILVSFGSQNGTIKVIASSSCDTDSAILDLVCSVVPNAGKDTTICAGGTATLTATGGIKYIWNTGNAADTTAIIKVNPSSTKTYTVTVSNGSCSKSDSVVVTVNKLSVATVTGTTTVCLGDSTTLTASGGTTYQWNNFAITNSVTLKPIKDTTLTVKIGNGCADTTISILVSIFSTTPKILGDSSICTGDSTTLTATGGTSYAWSTGATTASITLAPANDITVSVTVKNGTCTGVANVTVKVGTYPTVSAGADKTICKGSSAQINGSGSGTTFRWEPVTGLSDTTIAQPIANPTVSTDYILTVANGKCSGKDTVAVNVNPLPDVVVTASKNTISCGDSTTLAVTGAANYSWVPSTGLSNNISANPVAKPTISTTYIATGTGANGCINSDTIAITVNPLNVVAKASNTSVTKGDSTSLSATGAQNYLWKPSTYLDNNAIANPIAKPALTITYIVTGSNSKGCSNSDTIIITVTEKDSCGEIFIPNAFSPNNNLLNDVFRARIPNNCVKEIFFAVYDRWGIKLFETTDVDIALTKGWDGTYQGEDVNSGVYVFYLRATLTDGEEILKKGNISLIR